MANPSTSLIDESLAPGTLFADRFVVDRVLGRGGMGIVFAARHLELDELVAVKVMLPAIAANAETAARFFREARASVRIKSDYVVRVLDVARLPDNTPFLVMEYLEGIDLDKLLTREGPIPLPRAAQFIIEAADAIAAAHAIGIVHRDIKPQNLFLAQQGDETYRIKVLDFGISKISEPQSGLNPSLTQTSVAMGSPLYMSPEQMQSAKTVDQRSDIWSLGCVLYELVTGQPPFNAPTVPELCAAVFHDPTPLATRIRPELPKAFNIVIARCLEKSAEYRYGTVAQLAQDLLPFAPAAASIVAGINRRRSSMPPPGSVAVSGAPPPRNPAAVTAGGWGQATGDIPNRARRTRRRVMALAASVVVVGGVSYWSLRHGTGAPQPSALATAASNAALAVSSPSSRQNTVSARASHEELSTTTDAGVHALLQKVVTGDAARPSAGTKPRLASAQRAAPASASAEKKSVQMTPGATNPTVTTPRAPSLRIDIK
jgi:serine/threonine-protein kinase